MGYQWDSSLETGHEKIDNQHRQLVSALNELYEAGRSGKGGRAILDTMDFLTSYTIKHFSDELKLQKDFNYPDYLVHERIHEDFKIKVKELAARLVAEGPSQALVDEVSGILGAWFLNHIKGDDFRMAAFIKARAAGN